MSFDTLAPWYRAMELVLAGNLLQSCRRAFLREAAQCRSALLLGEGPGRYLVELIRANPEMEVTCIDTSPRMLEIARAQVARARLPVDRLQLHCTDIRSCKVPVGAPELIATHFFLDCFPSAELSEVIARVASLAPTAATWVISDFRVPERGWQRVRSRLILKVAYWFFAWTTRLPAKSLSSPEEELQRHGFRLEKRQLFNHGLLHADWWRRTEIAAVAGLPQR